MYRKGVHSDADQLSLLDARCFYLAWNRDEWAGVIRDHYVEVFEAYRQAVGVCVASSVQGEPRTFQLQKVMVRPDYRLEGHGTTLALRLRNALWDSEIAYEKIRFWVPEEYTDARQRECCLHWIQQLGFKATATVSGMYYWLGEYQDGIKFEVEI